LVTPPQLSAFVTARAESFDEGIDILGQEELAMATETAGVVQESDEAGLDGSAIDLDVRAVEGIGLPHFVGVGFGKGQPLFAFGLGCRESIGAEPIGSSP
jgi:hypothetical protein